MSSAAQTIKERLGIAEVVGAYIKIEKTGANYKARCPFHNEKTPSFFISPARNNYYCFGCGAKGDIFTFVEEFEKIDFLGALKILAEKAGIELEQFQHDRSKESDLDKLRNILETSTVFYEEQLHKNTSAKFALDYLLQRGLTDETIKTWRIGLASNEWRTLGDYLRSKNISNAEMEKVGLIKQTGTSVYDRFRERIMFPLFDSSGSVVGYSGRYIEFPKVEKTSEQSTDENKESACNYGPDFIDHLFNTKCDKNTFENYNHIIPNILISFLLTYYLYKPELF